MWRGRIRRYWWLDKTAVNRYAVTDGLFVNRGLTNSKQSFTIVIMSKQVRLNEDNHKALVAESKRTDVPIVRLVNRIIQQWLADNAENAAEQPQSD